MRIIENKTNAMKRLEREHDASLEELLYKLHYEQNMSYSQMADYLIVSKGTLTHWMRKAEIMPRSVSV